MRIKSQSMIIPDVIFIIFARFTVLFSSFLQTAIILRILSLEIYGIYSLFTSSFTLGLSLSMMGIGLSLTRLISKNPKKYVNLVFDAFSLMSIICIITTIIFYLFMHFSCVFIYKDPGLMEYLRFAALGLFLGIFSNFSISFLQGLSEMRKIAVITIIARLTGLIIAFFLVISLELMGAILAYFVYLFLEIIFSIIAVFRIRHKHSFKFSFRLSRKNLLLFMKYGSAFYLLEILTGISFWLGITLLDIISGHKEVGIYQVGQFVFSILQQVGVSFVFVLFPKFSSLERNISNFESEFKNILVIAIKVSFSIQFILGIGFLMLQDLFLMLFNLREESRMSIVIFIAIAPAILGLGYILTNTFLLGMSKFKILFVIKIMFLITYVLSAIVLIPIFGAIGLILSLLIAWIAQIVISGLYTKRKLLSSYSMSRWLIKSLVIMLFYLISYLICISSYLFISIPLNILLCGSILFFGTIFIIFVIFDYKDRMAIINIIRKPKQLIS